ncbi:hypothetical protein LTR56_002018 [Elasticomyces elasticus]|nr:hypothetical protein LTR22_022259 [Elasticomyces elasticus]KAK3658161.1 hypothetical protein LTR56_002018 [Elasticomyces elasticus]KAK4907279.1 hypothetical protein LTR49_023692 [Elasticomyces elasticus]KAK5764046.1 hypothetical protein LTS12_005740 [Elasticomyces elasticus]
MAPTNTTLLAALNATMHNATTAAAISTATCTLSPRARALSAMIGGISGGHVISWFIAGSFWFASLRVLVVGFWATIEALRGRSLQGGDEFLEFYCYLFSIFSIVCQCGPPVTKHAEATTPTVLGYLAWLWSAVYSPVVQTMWLVENWHQASLQLKLVRAFGVTITALPLTLDTKARYGAALGARCGKWSEKLFNLATATGCLVLGVVASTELVLVAIEIQDSKTYMLVLYPLVLLGGTFIGFGLAVPVDKTSPMNLYYLGYSVSFGLLAAVLTACLPFAVYTGTAHDVNGTWSNLGEYLKCEPVALWQKAIAVLP